MLKKIDEAVDYHVGIDYEKIRNIVREEMQKALIEFYYEWIKPQPRIAPPPWSKRRT